MNRHLIPYALGALLLGIIGVAVHDFALQWQPVPESIPLRLPLAYLSALILLVSAGLLFTRRWRDGALTLGLYYTLCAIALHGPKVAQHASDVGAWLGLAEIGGLATAGLLAWATFEPKCECGLARLGQMIFGVCLLIYGTSHFVYADFTATMIPGWLPAPLFWAYLTGCGHLAAGLSLISGIATRLASTLLTAMIACFVLLLHLPRVIATPSSRMEWTMLAVSLSIFGAAVIVRASTAQSNLVRTPVSSPA